jgi:hypothetical protein
MYYSKGHGKLPLPGIFRFPASFHAPSVLFLLLVAEGIDGFAKGSVISLSANSSTSLKRLSDM